MQFDQEQLQMLDLVLVLRQDQRAQHFCQLNR